MKYYYSFPIRQSHTHLKKKLTSRPFQCNQTTNVHSSKMIERVLKLQNFNHRWSILGKVNNIRNWLGRLCAICWKLARRISSGWKKKRKGKRCWKAVPARSFLAIRPRREFSLARISARRTARQRFFFPVKRNVCRAYLPWISNVHVVSYAFQPPFSSRTDKLGRSGPFLKASLSSRPHIYLSTRIEAANGCDSRFDAFPSTPPRRRGETPRGSLVNALAGLSATDHRTLAPPRHCDALSSRRE